MDYRTPEWQEDANCVDTDPESWTENDPETHRVLERICASCPVIEQCFDAAIAEEEEWSFRAGLWFGPRPGQSDSAHYRELHWPSIVADQQDDSDTIPELLAA